MAVDTIINQRDSDVVCFYVAIGQKSSSVRQVIEAVRSHGEVLRQGRHAPRDLGTEVALLLAVTEGLLDKVPVPRVRDFVSGLGPWLAGQVAEALSRLRAD